ncbi:MULTISPECIES: chaperone modulator CbpM [unclassified Proteiniphilum]|uniref:chaperone modulator CbpM n=1 Tax=unclassified Proteiniphilum TaxID=2622718 RepID=UPI0025E38256|nr:chaperone modulator CbpM [Proteiniphilum sp. UBA5384]
MSGNRLLYSECLRIYEIEESFIESLSDVGLIHVIDQDDNRFIEYDDLSDLEQFIRWHYEMDINVPGIDALRNMLERVRSLQSQIERLHSELQFYKALQ